MATPPQRVREPHLDGSRQTSDALPPPPVKRLQPAALSEAATELSRLLGDCRTEAPESRQWSGEAVGTYQQASQAVVSQATHRALGLPSRSPGAVPFPGQPPPAPSPGQVPGNLHLPSSWVGSLPSCPLRDSSRGSQAVWGGGRGMTTALIQSLKGHHTW